MGRLGLFPPRFERWCETSVVDAEAVRFARALWARRHETIFANRWLGLPALQNPFDAWVIQEIIGETRPDVIVETGSFAGGGAALWASLLAMYGKGRVVSIDTEPEIHGAALEVGVIKERVDFVEGSSSDPALAERVARETEGRRVMVILDSGHSAEHVRRELDLWSPLVTPGAYLVVQDGVITAMDPDHGPGPLEATLAWLPSHPEFEVDSERERMLLTFCPSGYLRRRDQPAATAERTASAKASTSSEVVSQAHIQRTTFEASSQM